MNSFRYILCLFLSTLIANIAFAQRADFHQWAPTPPMGWNSWDCYGPTVVESEVKANADYMAKYLEKAGWEYIIVDIRWYVGNDKAHGYNETDPDYLLDEYGRFQPAINRFPSAAGGKGFKPLADYIHREGLKFGIHIMRGIPVLAVKRNLPILDSKATAKDIYSADGQCQWLKDMYTVVAGREGAQEYYNSLFKLYAYWGIDFVKVDDLSRPYHTAEIEMIRKAIDLCGRKIVLSTSPGETPVADAGDVQQHANMWRTVDDFWDNWQMLKDHFDVFERWNKYRMKGAWPDGDMLPLGHIGLRAERGEPRMTSFTRDEQYTLVTLWCIFRSPLMFGGDLPGNDAFTLSLLNNKEVIAVLKNSTNNKELFRTDNAIGWIADDPETGDKYLALFNVSNAPDPLKITVPLGDLGLKGTFKLRDLWAKKNLGTFINVTGFINKHGAGLYRLTPTLLLIKTQEKLNKMIDLKEFEVWFVTGSQHLYGDETLRKVAEHSQQIAKSFNENKQIPVRIVFKPTVKSAEEIYNVCQEANTTKNCIGIIAWMHTFSPAKMWIGGLKILQRPLMHLHTQFNRDIPWESIDMDFMNLNQSAHGDREFGFIMSRMRLNRKVVVGHWEDVDVLSQIGAWSRVAAGWNDWQGAKFVRFGDNMRYVAVTDGDKVEAEIKFGYSVNTHGVGDLVKVINEISDAETDKLIAEYEEKYAVVPSLHKGGAHYSSMQAAAKIELGISAFLKDGNYKGFTDTFEDLHGMVQLPGIAAQRLMAQGYGFAGEGDWKTAALVRAMKVMGSGLKGGNSFMEDYTYHFDPKNQMVLGSHMLEICESIADGKANCEIHPLGIGGKADPVRLVFNVPGGPALNASVIDMGNRFRLLVNEVEAVKPEHELPNLPVARVLWKPYPDMKTGCAAWILAGGAHHTCYSQNLTSSHLEDFAEMAGIEYVLIDRDTRLHQLKKELQWSEVYYK